MQYICEPRDFLAEVSELQPVVVQQEPTEFDAVILLDLTTEDSILQRKTWSCPIAPPSLLLGGYYGIQLD